MEYGRAPGCEVHEDRGVTWFATGLQHPLFNGVMTAQLAPRDVDRRIDELVQEFQARGLPLEWTVGTSTVPRELGAHLEATGLRHVVRVPGMAVPLGEIPEEPPPDGLTVATAESREEIEAAIRIALATFEIPVEFAPRLTDIEMSLPEPHGERARIYLGRLQGRPVASSMLFASAGVAGIYFVGTLAGVRGRGIARTMTAAALREGRDRGYRIGSLQATEMGVPVYRRLGFQAYSEFAIYS